MANIETKNLRNVVIDENGNFIVAPEHETIQLTNEDTVGYKAFTTLCVDDNDELLIGVVGEEMKWDFDSDNDNIINWTVGDSDLVCSKGYLVRLFGFDNSQFNSKVFLIFKDGYTINWSASALDGKTILNNGDILNTDSSINDAFKLWDGNGFGENGKFNQLTNGVMTDLNGNTVRTYNGFKRTGYYI